MALALRLRYALDVSKPPMAVPYLPLEVFRGGRPLTAPVRSVTRPIQSKVGTATDHLDSTRRLKRNLAGLESDELV